MHRRVAGVVAVLVMTSTYSLLLPLLTPTGRETDTRVGPPPARAPCRPDMAVNGLPPMPESDSELVLQLFRYLTRPHPRTCHKVARMGGKPTCGFRQIRPGSDSRAVMDGHKFVCLDGEQLDLPHTEHGLVYSIGINYDWTFDDAMADFGCSVFAFDPTMNASSAVHDAGELFLPLGVGGRDETTALGWRLLTLDSLTALLGHEQRTIHYLKMDVEGAEWAVLSQQARRGRRGTLARVQQLGAELHFLPYLPPERHTAFYRRVYGSLLELQQLGFYAFAFEENQILLDWVQIPGLGRNLTTAMEVVWLRSECARQAAAATPLTSDR